PARDGPGARGGRPRHPGGHRAGHARVHTRQAGPVLRRPRAPRRGPARGRGGRAARRARPRRRRVGVLAHRRPPVRPRGALAGDGLHLRTRGAGQRAPDRRGRTGGPGRHREPAGTQHLAAGRAGGRGRRTRLGRRGGDRRPRGHHRPRRPARSRGPPHRRTRLARRDRDTGAAAAAEELPQTRARRGIGLGRGVVHPTLTTLPPAAAPRGAMPGELVPRARELVRTRTNPVRAPGPTRPRAPAPRRRQRRARLVPYAWRVHAAAGPRPRDAVPYAELHAHTAYSFLDGASSPEAMAEAAAELGLTALAITDHDGLYGVVRFAEAAAELGLATVVGAELSLPGGEHLLVLARGGEGYRRLSRVIARAHLRGGAKGEPRYEVAELAEAAGGHWYVLTGCRRGRVRRALERGGGAGGYDTVAARTALDQLVDLFGADRVIVELTCHGVPEDTERCDALAGVAAEAGLPVVATTAAHCAGPEDARLASVMASLGARES